MADHGFVHAVLFILLAAAVGPLFAQDQPPASTGAPSGKSLADRNDRRLFQRFVEDAAVSTGGWIELQYRFDNLQDGTQHFLGPLVAFKIVNDFEGGLRFGWQDVNPDSGPNESGFSDIDLYGKYRFPGNRSRTAVGGLVKLPKGDEEKGLGTGKEDFEVFVAWRADLDAVSIVANVAARYNGNPDPPLPSSSNSALVGGALLLPVSARNTFVIEATFETERVEGASNDARLTLGFQHRGRERKGGFRGAAAIPLSDGAPDYQALFGAYLTY